MFRAGVLLMAGLTGFLSLNATLRPSASVAAQAIPQQPAGTTGTTTADQADQPSANFSLRTAPLDFPLPTPLASVR